jgi:hypothetical protein
MALYDLMISSAGTAHSRGHGRVTTHLAVRVAALVTVAAAYVGIRQTVSGGEQLVSIFRKVGFAKGNLHLSMPMHAVLQ